MTVSAEPTVQIENDDVRVTQWLLPPDSAIGHHRHDLDYVIVPITGGDMTIIAAGETSIAQLTSGQTYFRKAGVEHDVQNRTETSIVFLEIEIKR